MPHNARFLYQQPKIEINNYLIVNWFSPPLQFVKKHLVLLFETVSSIRWNQLFSVMKLKVPWQETILSKGEEDKTRQVRKDFFILSFLPIFVSVKEIKGEQ